MLTAGLTLDGFELIQPLIGISLVKRAWTEVAALLAQFRQAANDHIEELGTVAEFDEPMLTHECLRMLRLNRTEPQG